MLYMGILNCVLCDTSLRMSICAACGMVVCACMHEYVLTCACVCGHVCSCVCVVVRV